MHAVLYLVGHVHDQGLGGVVLEVPRVLQVRVRALQCFAGEAEALPYGGLRALLVLRGPVGIHFVPGVALDGPLGVPHRVAQLAQPGHVAGVGVGVDQG